MNIHEYQAKAIFSSYGIPIPEGSPITAADQALSAAEKLGGKKWVVKAQVHAGGRGKGGGIKLVHELADVTTAAEEILGMQLVTPQTDADGLPVNTVYVEQASDIAREIYLGLLVDRGSERVVIMASSAGGMDIEEVAAKTPEKIFKEYVNPTTGLQGFQARNLGFALDLDKSQVRSFESIAMKLYKIFMDLDVSLLEINPLIVTTQGELVALDAKINFDGSALFRHPELLEMRDPSQEDETENLASQHGLNYVSLDGNIACMVNGAGLAMATMDLIKLHGGEPANFLDVGGAATQARVAEAFKIILSNSNVKAILVNIFGGIVRCDLIADGIIQAVQEVGVQVPVVVRLEGTNAEKGRAKLKESGLDIIPADDLTDAAKKVIAAA